MGDDMAYGAITSTPCLTLLYPSGETFDIYWAVRYRHPNNNSRQFKIAINSG